MFCWPALASDGQRNSADDREVDGRVHRVGHAVGDLGGEVEVDRVEHRRLFQARQDRRVGAPDGPLIVAVPVQLPIVLRAPHREGAEALVIIVQRQPDLLQVVGALHPPRGVARRLHRGQEQRDQDPDDRHDRQQLDQGEAARGSANALPVFSEWM